MLDRTQILAAEDRVLEKVHVPEWKGDVYVRSLTAAEHGIWQDQNLLRKSKGAKFRMDWRIRRARTHLVVIACCNENGESLFKDSDVELLMTKNYSAIDRVASAIERVSGINREAEEDIEGNSEPDRNTSSVSG